MDRTRAVGGAPISRAGFTLNQMLLSLIVLGCICWGSYYFMRHRALAEEEAKNLRLIYMALELYEVDNGHLPNLAFFPRDARFDSDSLLVRLERYGVNESMTTCTTAPESLRETGLSFVWNPAFSGRRLHEPRPREWMMVEVHAVSDRVPAPHLGRYLVLYSDGTVERSRTPPAGVRI